ncbi:SDR family oxidoreductase [uncultured Bacteroides sp.]|uniref:SDR family oxidoreductase n=1 Tax=uncultured Bacteroides sp. TaxID=162156 RepID=UPI002AA6348E|nr:SDR family oxidoreductase [uncultured Bacteroides sp.]
MKVFVTGATGFIGSAVVKELIAAGHQVLGLARSEASGQKLKIAGAEVHYGDLTDTESLIAGAQAADGVIHLGFIHDFSRFAEVCAIDRQAIETMGEALIGADKPFVVTSGTGVVAMDGMLTEDIRPMAVMNNPRLGSEQAVDTLAAKGCRVSVVRLPPSVHGEGDKHGFVPILINLAREKGKAAIVNDGKNVWPAVHRLDAARVFRLALEKTASAGTRYHAVSDQGIEMKTIAGAIAARLNVPLVSLAPDQAGEYFTWFTHFASFNNSTSAKTTQEMLGWQPEYPGLMADLEDDVYFPAE